MEHTRPARFVDLRLYQIAALSGLLLYGVWRLDFQLGPAQATITLLTALAVQWLGGYLTGARDFEAKSALISGLSLRLLMRTNVLWLAAAAAAAAIGSKFLLRWRGKHLLNPTNFALVLFSGGSGVSGDGRSDQFPRPLRAASPMDG